jgi:hypothetical protein
MKARQKGADADAEAAAARAADLAPVIAELQGERRYLTAGHRKCAQLPGHPDGSWRQVVCGIRP